MAFLGYINPWGEFEKRCAGQFRSQTGNPALHVRVAFDSLIVKEKLKQRDEDTVQSIQVSHYLQYFFGNEAYNNEKHYRCVLYGALREATDTKDAR